MNDWITAAEMDEVVRVHFGEPLENHGFRRTDKRRWVRSRIPEFRDVFEFVSLRHSLNPRWGFSLDYCPTIHNDDLKWHRTEKGARIDVVYDPIDYVHPTSPEFYAWLLPYTQSRSQTAHCAGAVSDRALSRALDWFSQIESLDSLLDRLQTKAAERAVRFGFKNYVQQPLALLLTHAKLGDATTAFRLLKTYSTDYDVSPRAAARLAYLIRGESLSEPL